ncbi:acetate kinase [Cellulomonas fimi]|uniref:Acetate kinase n=1 Tax=Cellulomonas fimi (strain ATCC 484 / DSM 20113 / JCM 1341 / CCUG 24087 / LMG 16345 / NBRC 15513 / NCIMB 8980 / NCTC 7547 / NRS-133) TaxID=590998 RepID=F4H2J4_CELFA|nr:acetate kinase [Cellulomonas fimi]AEE45220.1 acetate kinase [Cellulomonas fimi ATCC 484]NNH07114.1 acetate kinase [Cellulomonas fimi]VEH28615.1 Acetate kinase [Cellulomonas fimi]
MTSTQHTTTRGTVLVVNSGSSSIKYQLVDPVGGEAIASGLVERIGEDVGTIKHTYAGSTTQRDEPIADHGAGLRLVLGLFDEIGPELASAHIVAVGHRVVHGGSDFAGPALVDDDVVRRIDALSPLAPLHNPPNLTGIQVARELLPDVPHVVVFDTAFFHTLPDAAATYAIDQGVATAYGVRRYGFHGTSHQFVSGEVARFLGRRVEDLNQIVLHLGNGASASAVRGGVAVETSMGLTPLEGLVMGTRSGDLDPAVLIHLQRNAGMSVDEIDDLLNRRSGLKGLAGENDFREIHRLVEEGDASARRALDVYIHRLRKYVGAYLAVLGRVDVITFTAGVGENDDIVRALALAGLEPLGIAVDAERNAGRKKQPVVISPDWTPTKVLVLPTNEELAIARQAVATIEAAGLEGTSEETDPAPAAAGHA